MARRGGSIRKRFLYRVFLLIIAACISKVLISAPEEPCTNDPLLFGTLDPCKCFSETYWEARSRFRSAAKNINAELFSFDVYQNYTMDMALIQGEGPGLVVHTSGVHGVEGYAGSAIQIAYLTRRKEMKEDASSSPSILLIHSVNPYGMANFRRVNENNIDLNRNGLHDFSNVLKREPNVASYVDFDHILNPSSPFRYGFFLSLLPALLKHGLLKLKHTMVTGQYHKSEGIFYGGKELESSNGILYNFTEKFLRSRLQNTTDIENRDGTCSFDNITWINVHTGLGRSGSDTILLLQVGKEKPAELKKMAKVFQGASIPDAGSGGDDVQNGYELVRGTTEELLSPLLTETHHWHLTQEFGTKPSILVGRALILENALHRNLPYGRALLRSAFYPRTPKWRKAIITRGLTLLQQAVGRT